MLYYTLGQRKGLDINAFEGPWFVVGKDVQTNKLYVARNEDNPWLKSTSCVVKDLNWFNPLPEKSFACKAKFRYRQKDQDVQLECLEDRTVLVHYPQGISAVTPGQEAVFYLDHICLGGGVIDEIYTDGRALSDAIAGVTHAQL